MLCHVLIGNKIFFIRAYNYQSSITQRDDMSVVGRKYILSQIQSKWCTDSPLFICEVSKSHRIDWSFTVITFEDLWDTFYSIVQASFAIVGATILEKTIPWIACWIKNNALESFLLFSFSLVSSSGSVYPFSTRSQRSWDLNNIFILMLQNSWHSPLKTRIMGWDTLTSFPLVVMTFMSNLKELCSDTINIGKRTHILTKNRTIIFCGTELKDFYIIHELNQPLNRLYID